ncbi:flavodoxin family protein [Oryzobacter telluris]|uniref:flavodoxin family protein n=1 Tax=Oryzobacter telluris TaxID=3149179 RepID=UPI00370D0222
MSRALVVYESFWGNTERVARAVADGIAEVMSVDVREVGAAPSGVEGVDLLVVGGPTHAFSMTRPSTRHDALEQGGTVRHPEAGLREWVDALPEAPQTWVAAFDTRVSRVRRLPGSAAHAADRRLHRHGMPRAAPPESFWVAGTSGPLEAHELDRARSWGHTVADVVPATV